MKKNIKNFIDQNFITFKDNIKEKIFKNFFFFKTFMYIKKIWVFPLILILYFLNITIIVNFINIIIYELKVCLTIITFEDFFELSDDRKKSYLEMLIETFFFFIKWIFLLFFVLIKKYLFDWFPLFIFGIYILINLLFFNIYYYFFKYIVFCMTILENFKWTFIDKKYYHYFISEPGWLLNDFYKIKYVGDNNITKWNDIYISLNEVFLTVINHYSLEIFKIFGLLFVWIFYIYLFFIFIIKMIFQIIESLFGFSITGILTEFIMLIIALIKNFIIYWKTSGLDFIYDLTETIIVIFYYILELITNFFEISWNWLKNIKSITDISDLFYQFFNIEWKKKILDFQKLTFADLKEFIKKLKQGF